MLLSVALVFALVLTCYLYRGVGVILALVVVTICFLELVSVLIFVIVIGVGISNVIASVIVLLESGLALCYVRFYNPTVNANNSKNATSLMLTVLPSLFSILFQYSPLQDCSINESCERSRVHSWTSPHLLRPDPQLPTVTSNTSKNVTCLRFTVLPSVFILFLS